MEQADFGAAGPNGDPVICANGKELRLPRELLVGPPSYDPSSGEPPPPNPEEEMVGRCGEGENPHRNARLVPISEDPLRGGRAGG